MRSRVGGIWTVFPAKIFSIVRIWIRGNLPKCSEVKNPAEAASSIMCEVAFSRVINTPIAAFSRPNPGITIAKIVQLKLLSDWALFEISSSYFDPSRFVPQLNSRYLQRLRDE